MGHRILEFGAIFNILRQEVPLTACLLNKREKLRKEVLKSANEYDKNDNLTKVTDRDGTVTTYEYDPINRVTEVHRPNGVSTYNNYNARDQIVTLKNICDECEWVVSQYDYTYDDRGFIIGEDVVESLYGYFHVLVWKTAL